MCAQLLGRSEWRYLDGATALHLAAINGDIGVCRVLIGAGSDLESRTSGFEVKTPLHFAVERLHVDIVELLVEAGADVNAKAKIFNCDQAYEQNVLHLNPLQLVRASVWLCQ